MARFVTTALLALLVLAGCASGPPPQADGAIPSGQVRITVTRSDSTLFLGLSSTITRNGETVGALWRNETLSTFAPAGRVTLTADGWSYPGRSRFSFTAEPGRSYSFAVMPRIEAFTGSMFLPLMLLDVASEDGGAFSLRPIAE